MSTQRPCKRRKLLVENFVDLEAGVCTDDEDSNDREYIEDKNEDSLEDADHDGYTSVDQEYPSYNHAALQREYQKHDSEEIWQGLIRRARERGMDKSYHCIEEDEDNERAVPHPEDILWEIPCKIGHEEGAVFKIMQRSISSTAAVKVLSAFARPSVPGRIFLEVKTVNDAIQAIAGITELSRTQIKLVPHNNMTEVLSMRRLPRPRPQTWLRLLGNTKKSRHYKGDIALVVEVTNSNLLELWVIPRLEFDSTSNSVDRPPARLFSVEGARKSFGSTRIRTRRYKSTDKTTFTFDGSEFSTQGYLILTRQEMYVCQAGEAVPTAQEFELFSGCEALLGETVKRTRARIQQATLAVHDRVKVVMGAFRGLLGSVASLHVDDHEVDVFLPSHEIVERVRVSEVIKEFRVGDRVKVNAGKDEAGADIVTLGWVTKVSASEVVFCNAECTEATVSPFQVEFYEDEKDIPLRNALANTETSSILMKDNPNKRLIKKRVVVTGANQYKGAKGTIRDVSLNGEASVMLEIFNESFPRKFMLRNLSLVRESSFVPINGGKTVPISRQFSLPITCSPAPSAPQPSAPSTPRPSGEEVSHEGDCWDPHDPGPLIAQVTDIEQPTWLHDVPFQRIRVKLRYRGNPSPHCLEFCGMDGQLAKVREGKQHKLVPLSSLLPVAPAWKDDIVTSFSTNNDMYGKLFKIREYHADVCVLRGFGQRTGRGEKNFTESTHYLAEVFPPLK